MIHFNAETPNEELLFRTVRSANQLNVHGAVASWCEELTQLIPVQSHLIMDKSVARVNDQLSQKLEPQEMDSLVQTPRTTVQAGDRLRTQHQRFEELSNEIQKTKACEDAGFMRRVSIGQYFKTLHDVDDGVGGKSEACREYTLPRDNPDSELIAWIGGHTIIGPVLQVKIICGLDQCGIEIKALSTSRNRSKSRIITSRGPIRNVEESWHDPDNSPGSSELANHTSVGRPHAIISSSGETRASQPETQWDLMGNHSEDFMLGAIIGNPCLCPMLRRAFEKEGAQTFSGSDWLDYPQRSQ